jgi:hypothetical protein
MDTQQIRDEGDTDDVEEEAPVSKAPPAKVPTVFDTSAADSDAEGEQEQEQEGEQEQEVAAPEPAVVKKKVVKKAAPQAEAEVEQEVSIEPEPAAKKKVVKKKVVV